MIVLASLDVNKVTTYHTEPGVTNVEEKTKNIKSAQEYSKLQISVSESGFLDPVIAMCTPQRPCMVEIGEQRVLLAREVGIKTLAGIAYTRDLADISFVYEQQLQSIADLEVLFKSRVITAKKGPEFTEFVNPTATVSAKKSYYVNIDNLMDPITNKPTTLIDLAETYLVSEPNGLVVLKKYLVSGIATF